MAVHKAVVSKLPSPMRCVKDCVQANVYNNVNQKKKVMPSDKNKGWKTQNKELLVQSLSTAPGATVARDLSIFNRELVVICKLLSRHNPAVRGRIPAGNKLMYLKFHSGINGTSVCQLPFQNLL